MAIPDNYIDKITKGNDSRMISPAADMVRVDNDNFEGTDLDGVLDEVAQAIEEAGNGAVSVTSNQDGTFVIHVGDTDYTINLNHTHENMAKLVVCEESDLPATLEDDTIYGVEDSGEISMLYVGGIPFYGGGGTSTPVLRQPADGSTIDVGTIASGDSSVTKTITVKGKILTQALTVAVTGTGYSVNKQSISAADANVGTTLVITCTSTADDAAGTLSIASSEVSCDCDLVANVATYENLAGIKLTGTQWLLTDYKPNAKTEFEMEIKFAENANSHVNDSSIGQYILSANDGSVPSNDLALYASAGGSDATGSMHNLLINVDGAPRGVDFSASADVNNFFADHAKITYVRDTNNGIYSFIYGTGANDKKVRPSGSLSAPPLKANEAPKHWAIGYRWSNGTIFGKYDLSIYGIKVNEKNNGSTTAVRNYVPKLKNGVPGLFDTVTGTFISSETGVELVAIPLT